MGWLKRLFSDHPNYMPMGTRVRHKLAKKLEGFVIGHKYDARNLINFYTVRFYNRETEEILVFDLIESEVVVLKE